MTEFLEIMKEIRGCKADIDTIKIEATKKIDDIKKRVAGLENSFHLRVNALDEDRISNGLKFIYINGKVNSDARKLVIDSAAKDVLDNFRLLRREFLGTKSYSGYFDQREDCTYGMMPRHGTIIFEIGLTKECRNKIDDLTDADKDDILYVLFNAEILNKVKQNE